VISETLFFDRVAVSRQASLTYSLSFLVFSVTFFGAAYTWTSHCADRPLWVVAVIVACPAFFAVTRPVSSTVAIFPFEVAQLTIASQPGSKHGVSCAFPLAGRNSDAGSSAIQPGAGPPSTRTEQLLRELQLN